MAKQTWKGGKLLLALADFLENDPRVKGHFDMGVVVRGAPSKRGKPDLTACGSAACALGWALHVPAIARAKVLRLDMLDRGDGWWCISSMQQDWSGGSLSRIGADAFDISKEKAYALFHPAPDHRTPKQVARNIRRFVTAERKRRGINVDA